MEIVKHAPNKFTEIEDPTQNTSACLFTEQPNFQMVVYGSNWQFVLTGRSNYLKWSNTDNKVVKTM